MSPGAAAREGHEPQVTCRRQPGRNTGLEDLADGAAKRHFRCSGRPGTSLASAPLHPPGTTSSPWTTERPLGRYVKRAFGHSGAGYHTGGANAAEFRGRQPPLSSRHRATSTPYVGTRVDCAYWTAGLRTSGLAQPPSQPEPRASRRGPLDHSQPSGVSASGGYRQRCCAGHTSLSDLQRT